jgi:hypothetical protein
MRVRGLQFRGLEVPRGERRLDLPGALCCIEAASAADARGLAWLLRALLQPDRDLAALSAWSPAPDARAALWLVSRNEAFLIAADAKQRRLQLGRRDGASSAYQARSSDPAEIAAFFAERCWPDRLDFELLRTWGVTPAEGWPEPPPEDDTLPTAVSVAFGEDPGSELVRAQMELERARAAQAERAGRIQRRDELRARGQRLAEQERELARVRAELEEQAPLAGLAEGIDQRIAGFQAAQEERDSGRREIQGQRRLLLAERSSLRAARARRLAPLWLGLASLGLGGGLAALGEWLGLGVSGLGALLAGIAFVQLRAVQRRLGRIEAVMAAQRVRERTGEQRFESETEPIRAALEALELQGIDALRSALDANQGLAKRAAELASALEAERGREPDLPAELARLEQMLAGPDPAEHIHELERQVADLVRVRVAQVPELPAPPAADPDQLVAAAARATDLDPGELHGRLGAALPLYLSALCSGDLTHARYRPSEGWLLRGPSRRGIHFAELPGALAARVSLAFQLALAERTAAERSAPFLIGPDIGAFEPDETRALGRALRRLAGFVQVIRIGPPDPAWAAHADLLVRVP